MRDKSKKFLITAPFVTGGILYLIARGLYAFAFDRSDLVPEAGEDIQKYADDYFYYVSWLQSQKKLEYWTLSRDKKHKLSAVWIPAEHKTDHSVIISHGYHGNGITMANQAQMFHQLGFNVLLPDNRGHGDSGDKYISFGWLDHYDYLRWLKVIIKKTGEKSKIYLLGVSMGAATVMMVAGEKLPPQVKGIIADCGYTSLNAELKYLSKNTFHIPSEPFLPIMSMINYFKNGFPFSVVSSLRQLKKATVPIFIIHGGSDKYVPTYMAYQNFNAIKSKKRLWIVPDAGHAQAFWINPQEYAKRVAYFIKATLN